jgi:hypothetical protein
MINDESFNDVLDTVPNNRKHVFVRGVTKSGCEIYMPVDSYDDEYIIKQKERLQSKLDSIDSALERNTPKLMA